MWVTIYLVETMIKHKFIREEISKAEKVKVISDIAASISHEVRNPLTVTKGFLQLLRGNDFSNEKKNIYLNLALEELERAQTIINDYLALAKPNPEKSELLSLKEEVGHAAAIMEPYANMQLVDIVCDYTEECWIHGERNKFRQALINLMKNSIEAMNQGGILRIQVRRQAGRPIIDIHDTGVGMTMEEVTRLGTPYFSSKENGTGLGMMVVFSIIKTMKGSITVKSEKGKGTHFSIMFQTKPDHHNPEAKACLA